LDRSGFLLEEKKNIVNQRMPKLRKIKFCRLSLAKPKICVRTNLAKHVIFNENVNFTQTSHALAGLKISLTQNESIVNRRSFCYSSLLFKLNPKKTLL